MKKTNKKTSRVQSIKPTKSPIDWWKIIKFILSTLLTFLKIVAKLIE